MSDLSSIEKKYFETLFEMHSGYVLNFSDRTLEEFTIGSVGISIHDSKYQTNGTSKAKKLRAFWILESNAIVAKLLEDLITYYEVAIKDSKNIQNLNQLIDVCKDTVNRLKVDSTKNTVTENSTTTKTFQQPIGTTSNTVNIYGNTLNKSESPTKKKMNIKEVIWNDPVWSKIIAAIIIFLFTAIFAYIKNDTISKATDPNGDFVNGNKTIINAGSTTNIFHATPEKLEDLIKTGTLSIKGGKGGKGGDVILPDGKILKGGDGGEGGLSQGGGGGSGAYIKTTPNEKIESAGSGGKGGN